MSLLTPGLAVGVGIGHADSVSDQRAEVNRIADQLDALEQRLGDLEEQHAAAADRMDALDIEIADSQARVTAQQSELGKLQKQLTSVAVAKFTNGGSTGVSPLFSSATAFTDDLQRDQLSRVALDQGAGTTDELQALLDALAKETASLNAKKAEQAALADTLAQRQQEGEQLSVELQTKYADAKARLGDLIEQERARREAAAAAAAQAAWQRAADAAANRRNTNNGGGAAGGDAGATAPSRGGGASNRPAPTPSAPAPNIPAPSSMSGSAIAAAQSQLGVAYKFAASTPGVAFDCSGLTKYAWAQAGVSLPHQSSQQYAVTPHVPKDQAQPGDLIFYYSPIGHVAMYLGGGMLIHAPATGDVVKISPVNWSKVVGVSRPG
ncbi:MAG: NlpC/P60 family protein [Ilumatobacteraceae bacterium]